MKFIPSLVISFLVYKRGTRSLMGEIEPRISRLLGESCINCTKLSFSTLTKFPYNEKVSKYNSPKIPFYFICFRNKDWPTDKCVRINSPNKFRILRWMEKFLYDHTSPCGVRKYQSDCEKRVNHLSGFLNYYWIWQLNWLFLNMLLWGKTIQSFSRWISYNNLLKNHTIPWSFPEISY